MAREGLRPPVKWAGGKRTLYKRLRPLMPELIPFYSEAFVGGVESYSSSLRRKRSSMTPSLS